MRWAIACSSAMPRNPLACMFELILAWWWEGLLFVHKGFVGMCMLMALCVRVGASVRKYGCMWGVSGEYVYHRKNGGFTLTCVMLLVSCT
jgi:hypothetical protein